MSFRGGFGRNMGGHRGGRGRGGFNKGRAFDRSNRGYDQGPPETVTPLGRFTWTVQDDLVVKADIEQVPFFNAPIYTENKQQVGKIDEIFGNIRDYYVSVKLSENVKASSFEKNTQLFIDPAKLLPLQRFLPKFAEQKRGGGSGRVLKRYNGNTIRGGGNKGVNRGSFGRGGGFGNRNAGGGFRGRGGSGNAFNRNNFGAGRGGIKRKRWD